MLKLVYFVLIAHSSASPTFVDYFDHLIRAQSKRETSLSCAPSTAGNFYVRVFASCGDNCCDRKFQRQCGGVLISKDQVLVPATCLAGHTCFKVCFGNDLCGEREPCVTSTTAFLHREFLDNVLSRNCMEENFGIIKITPFEDASPIELAHFKTPHCREFAGNRKLVSFSCGCEDNSVQTRRQIPLEGVSASEAEEFYSNKCGRGPYCSTLYAKGRPSKHGEDQCGACGEDGSPLVMRGEDLLRDFGSKLTEEFRERAKENPLDFFLIGIESYCKRPCLKHNPSAFVCLQAYQDVFGNGSSAHVWIHVHVANEYLIDSNEKELLRIDAIYGNYGVKVPCSNHTMGMKHLVQCVIHAKEVFLRRVMAKLECSGHNQGNLQCGGVSNVPSCSGYLDSDAKHPEAPSNSTTTVLVEPKNLPEILGIPGYEDKGTEGEKEPKVHPKKIPKFDRKEKLHSHSHEDEDEGLPTAVEPLPVRPHPVKPPKHHHESEEEDSWGGSGEEQGHKEPPRSLFIDHGEEHSDYRADKPKAGPPKKYGSIWSNDDDDEDAEEGPVEPQGEPIAPNEPKKDFMEPHGDPVEPNEDPWEPKSEPIEPKRDPWEPKNAPIEPKEDPIEPEEPQKKPEAPEEKPKEPKKETKKPLKTEKKPHDPKTVPEEPKKLPEESEKVPKEPKKIPEEPEKVQQEAGKEPQEPEKPLEGKPKEDKVESAVPPEEPSQKQPEEDKPGKKDEKPEEPAKPDEEVSKPAPEGPPKDSKTKKGPTKPKPKGN